MMMRLSQRRLLENVGSYHVSYDNLSAIATLERGKENSQIIVYTINGYHSKPIRDRSSIFFFIDIYS